MELAIRPHIMEFQKEEQQHLEEELARIEAERKIRMSNMDHKKTFANAQAWAKEQAQIDKIKRTTKRDLRRAAWERADKWYKEHKHDTEDHKPE